MSNGVAQSEPSWRRSRYGFAAFYGLSLILSWSVLRQVLLFSDKLGSLPASQVLAALLSGLQRDFFVALVETLPLLAWFWILPQRWFQARWHRVLFSGATFLVWFVQIFLLFTEFFFFDEFKSRFNTVAVDYLLFPREVFINIWESYHVGYVVAACAAVSVGLTAAAAWLFGRMWDREFTPRARLGHLAIALAVVAVMIPTINFKAARVSPDRTLNEVANNGAMAFVAAAWTRNLDYSAFYKTLPRDEAWQRTRRMLAETNTQFVAEGDSILRKVSGDPGRPRLNLVICLEESLGSEFWGCLGRTNTLTPEMDRLAAEEGMLFTNIYANGNRTVRGLEGVLASFPSLPGDSIVKRDRSDNIETIARVLKRDGYSTVFLYGGRGIFDGMRSFTVRNGYERFVEQKHFAKPTFTTIWGVCDEDLFQRAVTECHDLAQTGKPFCATILSVSNHKPYTYPAGRIPENPEQRRRENAVKYSDYALGLFFKLARKESFWTNTIFVVVADHGARVYGKQSIPIHSYEIPLLIAGPAAIQAPVRVGQLGCSLDIAPTILGMLGRPYETTFFGRDLLRMKPEDGRVFLNHNRDIGMLAHERLVVLGLNQTCEFYEGDPKVVDVRPLAHPSDADRELEKDATAIYQVADELYTRERYRIDSAPESRPPVK